MICLLKIQFTRTILFNLTSFSGLVTDGEFNSLRTQGDTGPLHTWQLVHDSKEVVRKMSKATLESMLTYAGGMYYIFRIIKINKQMWYDCQ